MKKILTIFGTRPEAIKLAPFIKAVEKHPDFVSCVCATTQQREMQNDVLKIFDLKVDHDLDIMKDSQDLFHVTESVLSKLKTVLKSEKPDFVVVQGDTTTAFTSALSGFYEKIPVVHVEAGLRTGDSYNPFPEEMNRLLIGRLASLHMAPTEQAKQALIAEGICENIFNVGNTIVDAVEWISKNHQTQDTFLKSILDSKRKKVLITVHRRENIGKPLESICSAVKTLASSHDTYDFIWPVHPNPVVDQYVRETMKEHDNLYLLEPLPYGDLMSVLSASDLILSDSGGIQEEASILEKKIVVLREKTERSEVIDAGWGILAGACQTRIVESFQHMLEKDTSNNKHHIYGKRGVCERILEAMDQ